MQTISESCNPELKKFITKQKEYFRTAYNELTAGKKTSHWIWYIFPQLKSLGRSDIAKQYGILNLNEACNYLKDAYLFENYQTLMEVVDSQLKKENPITNLMGGATDALKICSSITLFKAAAESLIDSHEDGDGRYLKLKTTCESIIQKTTLQGYGYCEQTQKKLSAARSFMPQKPALPKNPMRFFSPPQKAGNQALLNDLDNYLKKRKSLWEFNLNFLCIMSVIYFIQDKISGTDNFYSKSRSVKISAATKLRNKTQQPDSADPIFTASELLALQEGRLGEIISKHNLTDELKKHGFQKPSSS